MYNSPVDHHHHHRLGCSPTPPPGCVCEAPPHTIHPSIHSSIHPHSAGWASMRGHGVRAAVATGLDPDKMTDDELLTLGAETLGVCVEGGGVRHRPACVRGGSRSGSRDVWVGLCVCLAKRVGSGLGSCSLLSLVCVWCVCAWRGGVLCVRCDYVRKQQRRVSPPPLPLDPRLLLTSPAFACRLCVPRVQCGRRPPQPQARLAVSEELMGGRGVGVGDCACLRSCAGYGGGGGGDRVCVVCGEGW